MPRHCQLLAVLMLAMLALPASADESNVRTPTLNELLDSIPVLSPKNNQIRNARFTLWAWLHKEWEYPMRFDVQWAHNQPVGFLMSSTAWQTPAYFASQNQGMLSRISSHELVLANGKQPQLILRRGEASQPEVNLMFGNNPTNLGNGIEIDLSTLINRRAGRPVVEQDANGNWLVRTISATGGFDVLITFDRHPPYTLRRFEMRSLLTGKAQVILANLSLNDDSIPPWPPFPDLKTMPADFTVITGKKEQTSEGAPTQKDVNAAVNQIISMTMQVGFDLRKKNDNPLLKNIDWQEIDKAYQQSGPVLRQAFGFRPVVDQAFPTIQR
ncbi:hypothetical protein DTL42_08295 [Bremerella cremea]|uniref:Uncharacterized protein n=1 Tax=Bremerella cremea TaxID=1031537 RepID=A0A368KV91_9BACT|nr:hypothetical protein [Bremerella cremea]RCS52824.1 hypothetical protein DTL42_08295 [Bremerella cremea]